MRKQDGDRALAELGSAALTDAVTAAAGPSQTRPRVHHSLTARDCLAGMPALRMALMAAQRVTEPNIVASPANVAFANGNLAEAEDGPGRRP
jgi:hypothetical protein